MTNLLTRREMLLTTGSIVSAAALPQLLRADDAEFKFRYILGSSMYGYTDIRQILPEVSKIDASAIDIWPKVHGNQREQLDELGEEKFAALLKEHDVRLGCITQYKLGPFGLANEMKLAQRFGCATIVTGAVGPKDLKGDELKAAVSQFIEQMKPHLDVAAETGVTIAIENHSGSLLSSPDSIKWLVELRPSQHLGIALALYHLPQEEELLCDLIRNCGSAFAMFYAWQHGMGCMEKLPKEQELLQMPGRGDLKFQPLVSALREIEYVGWTEIFMHPVPRGIPILEPTSAVTDEINRARSYLAECLAAKG